MSSVVIFLGCGSPVDRGQPSSARTAPDAVGPATSPDRLAKEVMDVVTSTPQGRATVQAIADKDNALTAFQRAHGISERIAEAAIKEWVAKNGSFEWDLEEVKAFCLRNKRDGIPYDYLPEKDKQGLSK